ncbi:MAG: phage integrase N-terminal SAM-like domain-containing protein [Oscillospiraceae bacterium]|nr:phage integrase N-terminal SAM-like domain-containing protein [Oscillospiraceae bacterium]
MKEMVFEILNDMAETLTVAQLKKLQEVLLLRFSEKESQPEPARNEDYLEMFLHAKQVEGLSERTIAYYRSSVSHMLRAIGTPVRKITTDQIRAYLADYQQINNCGKSTVDNIRRNISCFFTWLEEEDHILKSPVRRIHKIKSKTAVKEVISDEDIERLRDNCEVARDVAIIDLLYSTGMRVGELVHLDIRDINFDERECVVYGKGGKERKVYFDARTKLHLQNYMLGMTAYTPLLLVSMVSRTSSTVIVRAFDSEGSAGVALAVLSALL